ncbi:MAG: response regulator transcription factor [Chloroflexi bacterium]|uniref:response regulator transcription factor n=1 Tax=Candidatus Flexifilum breve TaxID=3140694 RepID=UPI003137589C|nr:response regulator transcription factor [Chloroflexota bacterium]
MAIQVILADDHAVVRKGIRDFLEEEGDIQVIAEASDGAKAKELLSTLQPDVAVLDVRMPHATGIEVTRWIREQKLPVRVVILTAYDDDPFVVAAMQAGANGYVMKNAEAEEITAAVRAVYRGQSAIAPEIAQKVLTHLVVGTSASTPDEPLTDRERDILQLAAGGLTNKGIGMKLSISDRTVQGHLASIYGKLGVNSRTEAVTKALQLNIIQLEQKA